MSILSDSTPLSQDTDASIVAMLDELLAQDGLAVERSRSPLSETHHYELIELDTNPRSDGYDYKVIDRYETRAAAYRAGIDCMIELSIEGWEKGGQE